MMRKVDVIVVGSGFAGSIMAMILRRLGRSVVILEKGKHPRFAIGESSTPLANLLLEELAQKYDLPDLATFSKWGTWQAAHPEIACGLKRGFTFYKHEFGHEVDFSDRSQQLLVAASPHDRIADTHWYRPDFDAHMARKAVEFGAELHEEARFDLLHTQNVWTATGESRRGKFEIEADFLIDASGPRGCLFQHFHLPEEDKWALWFPQTQALFAHFKNVHRLNPIANGEPPFPINDAAVHHVFTSGWIWVLQFNNGITSAGVAAAEPLASELRLDRLETAWNELLGRLPTVKKQFAEAKPVTQFYFQRQLSFCIKKGNAVGKNWALLPSAIGFVDPLFSTGFVLTLLGIMRLAELFETASVDEKNLQEYERKCRYELDFAAEIVRTAYYKFRDFTAFVGIARIYFTAAIWSETVRRLHKGCPSFLLSDTRKFAALTLHFLHMATLTLTGREVEEAAKPICDPYDLAGLGDETRQNWHPARAEDLFANACKIPATREEIESMLKRCGF